jgi:hypothetical protein
MSTVVYGPQGCVKTTNAAAIAKHLGFATFLDEHSGPWLADDILVFTNVPTEGALDYFEIMREIEEAA